MEQPGTELHSKWEIWRGLLISQMGQGVYYGLSEDYYGNNFFNSYRPLEDQAVGKEEFCNICFVSTRKKQNYN